MNLQHAQSEFLYWLLLTADLETSHIIFIQSVIDKGWYSMGQRNHITELAETNGTGYQYPIPKF